MTTAAQHLIQMMTGVRTVADAGVGGVAIDMTVPPAPTPQTPESAIINGLVNTPLDTARINAALGLYEVGAPEPWGTFEVGPPEYPGPGYPGRAEIGVVTVIPHGVGIDALRYLSPGLPYPMERDTAQINAADGFYAVETYPPTDTAQIRCGEASLYETVIIDAAAGRYELDASGASYPGRAEVGPVGLGGDGVVLEPPPAFWIDLIEVFTPDECRLDHLVLDEAILT